MIGLMVNGVGIYDQGDAFAFVQAGSSPVTGSDSMMQTNTAHPRWRDALTVEVVIFSGVRRMRTGFILRDGTNGTTNIPSTGRTTPPKRAAIAEGFATLANYSTYGTKSGATGATIPTSCEMDYFNASGANLVKTFPLRQRKQPAKMMAIAPSHPPPRTLFQAPRSTGRRYP